MKKVRASTRPIVSEPPAVLSEQVDDMRGWPDQACCCPARPVVKVLLPIFKGDSAHIVDLYLCGHHYRESFSTLVESGATTIARQHRLALC